MKLLRKDNSEKILPVLPRLIPYYRYSLDTQKGSIAFLVVVIKRKLTGGK
jgi:hypothetical protein